MTIELLPNHTAVPWSFVCPFLRDMWLYNSRSSALKQRKMAQAPRVEAGLPSSFGSLTGTGPYTTGKRSPVGCLCVRHQQHSSTPLPQTRLQLGFPEDRLCGKRYPPNVQPACNKVPKRRCSSTEVGHHAVLYASQSQKNTGTTDQTWLNRDKHTIPIISYLS